MSSIGVARRRRQLALSARACADPATERRGLRLTLRSHDLPTAALTPVVDCEQRMALRIVELSALHIRAEASAALRDLLVVGTHHWLELPLPDDRPAPEWVVRLTHVGERPGNSATDGLTLSFAICAGEDATRNAWALEQVATCVARSAGPDGRIAGAVLEGVTC